MWRICSAANTPKEEGLRGRDAAYRAGFSVKTGGGFAGLDYTKVCNSGDTAGSGTCPPEPVWGAGPAEWACTHDNITGLTWEVKVHDSTNIHHRSWGFTWYDPDPATNGGNPRVVGDGTTCPLSECNTQSFAAAMNAAGLCGYSDWRLPSVRELQTIIACAGYRQPSIWIT